MSLDGRQPQFITSFSESRLGSIILAHVQDRCAAHYHADGNIVANRNSKKEFLSLASGSKIPICRFQSPFLQRTLVACFRVGSGYVADSAFFYASGKCATV